MKVSKYITGAAVLVYHSNFIHSTNGHSDQVVALELLEDDLQKVFTELAAGDLAAQSTWDLMLSHPKYTILNDPESTHHLCLVLSELDPDLIDEGEVLEALQKLNLYKEPLQQVECVKGLVNIPSEKLEAYKEFLIRLPIISKPQLWPHFLWAVSLIDEDSNERMGILQKVPRLTRGTGIKDFQGQFCAMKEVKDKVPIEFIKLLPVFTRPEGVKFLRNVKSRGGGGGDPCKNYFDRPKPIDLLKVLANSNSKVRETPKVKPFLDDFKFNEALAGLLDIEGFKDLIFYHVSRGNLAALNELVNATDLLIRGFDVEDVLTIASLLATDNMDPKIFVNFFKRISKGTIINKKVYTDYLFAVLLHSKRLNLNEYYEWYIEITLLEPSLLGVKEVTLPFWDELFKPENGNTVGLVSEKESFTILPANPALIELVVAKSKCLTLTPLVEPSSCSILQAAVKSLGHETIDYMNNGYWRLASLTFTRKDELITYLTSSINNHSIPTVAWVLASFHRDKELFNGDFLANLCLVVTNEPVKVFLELFIMLVPKIPQKPCRATKKENSMTINGKTLTVYLDKREEEEEQENGTFSILSQVEKYEIIKALISAITNIHPDNFNHLYSEYKPVVDVFNEIMLSFCSKWSSLDPNIIATPAN